MTRLLSLLLIGILSACSFREDKVGSADARPMRPWFTNLKETVFRPKCGECHTGTASRGKIDLMEYDSLMGVVKKGKPEDSPLYKSLAGIGGDMPRDRKPLSQRETKMIYDWIAKQAPFDGTEPEPDPPPEPTWKWLRTYLIPQKCFNCHKGAGADGGINLDHYEDFANDETILIKGDPDASLIYDVVKTDFMPYKDSRTKLTPEEKKALYDWIKKGAPKEEAP